MNDFPRINGFVISGEMAATATTKTLWWTIDYAWAWENIAVIWYCPQEITNWVSCTHNATRLIRWRMSSGLFLLLLVSIRSTSWRVTVPWNDCTANTMLSLASLAKWHFPSELSIHLPSRRIRVVVLARQGDEWQPSLSEGRCRNLE
jgi:hypothetical protein